MHQAQIYFGACFGAESPYRCCPLAGEADVAHVAPSPFGNHAGVVVKKVIHNRGLAGVVGRCVARLALQQHPCYLETQHHLELLHVHGSQVQVGVEVGSRSLGRKPEASGRGSP